ncbi:MAG: 50S ribosomal protein L11 [Candidatus Micrarchaeia archaeon]
MAKQSIPALVEGGKANAGPPIGPTLAPMKVNIQGVVNAINEATKDFAGLQVPVTIVVDTNTKEFEIIVGTPPVSALIKREIGKTGALTEEAGKKGKPNNGNLSLESALKIARSKQAAMLSKDAKHAVREVAGTCLSMGVTVDGKNARQFLADVATGAYDAKIKG